MKLASILSVLFCLLAAPAFAQQSTNLQCTPERFRMTSSKTDEPFKPYKGGEVHNVSINGSVVKVTTYKNGVMSGQPITLGNAKRFNENGTQSYMWSKDEGPMRTAMEVFSNNSFSFMTVNKQADVALQQVGFCKPI